MRYMSITLALAASMLTGCTALSLERHTINQATSVSALRYQEVVDNLAAACVCPGRLPAFSLISQGGAAVSDTGSIDSNTTWYSRAVNGFSTEVATAVGKRNPDLNWTLAPVASQPQLEAIKCAYEWVVCGMPDPASECMSLLREADLTKPNDYEKYHFDVANQLRQLPSHWYHVGYRKDVPANACYVGHYGSKYVWVTPDGMLGLSEFTLVLLDIATIDPSSLLIPLPTASLSLNNGGTTGTTITATLPAMQDSAGKPITVARPDDNLIPPQVMIGDVPSVTLPLGPRLTIGSLFVLPSTRGTIPAP